LKGFEETPNHYVLIQEYVDGMDLCAYMEARNFQPVPEAEAKAIILQVLEAIAHCHSKGICHRDIKLDNILITASGQVKIIDFGLATRPLKEQRIVRDYVGSVEYVAPEVLKQRPYDPYQADAFSIGVCLFGLLTGEFPFVTEERRQERYTGVAPTLQWKGAFSLDAKDVLIQMLSKDPKKRPSVEAILHHRWFQSKKPTRTGSARQLIRNRAALQRFSSLKVIPKQPVMA
jgi:serine/threonine protein kinase